MIDAGGRRIYFAGDTAYSTFFPEIPRRLGPLDLALLPIGAYEPRWFMQSVHMNPAEAVDAHLALGAPETIGMHFGTFQLTTEGIDEPLRALEDACRAAAWRRGGFARWGSVNRCGWGHRGRGLKRPPSTFDAVSDATTSGRSSGCAPSRCR